MILRAPLRPLRSPWRILLRVGVACYLTFLLVVVADTWADAPYAELFLRTTVGWSDYLKEVFGFAALGIYVFFRFILLVAALLWIIALVWSRSHPQRALFGQGMVCGLSCAATAAFWAPEFGFGGVAIAVLGSGSVVFAIWALRRWRKTRHEVPA